MEKNKAAFLEMLSTHKRILFKVSNSYCSNTEDQKDLVQDIIVQLWRSFDKYNPQFKQSTWVYRIALNVAISAYRKSSTRKKYQTNLDIDFVQIAATEEDAKEEAIELLREFVRELDELNKALMILYLDGNSHEEIALILHLSKTNVGTKISRIKQKLKTHFQKKSEKWN